MVLSLCVRELRAPFLGESESPFIDEEDGFTSERARVRTLSSLVVHVYPALSIPVGAKG